MVVSYPTDAVKGKHCLLTDELLPRAAVPEQQTLSIAAPAYLRRETQARYMKRDLR